MVLFNHVVEILRLDCADFGFTTEPLEYFVHLLDSGAVGPAFVDDYAQRDIIRWRSFGEEQRCRSGVPVLRQHEIKGLAHCPAGLAKQCREGSRSIALYKHVHSPFTLM